MRRERMARSHVSLGGDGDEAVEVPDEAGEGEECECGVEEAVAGVEGEAVGEVVEGLDEEGIHLAVANIGGDLPLVFRGGDEVIHEDDEEEVPDHGLVIVAGYV
jgi:hypothetical protein